MSSGQAPAEGELASLRVLHESVVRAEEVDALGHMNVRFYGERAFASTERLLSELGVKPADFGATQALGYELPRLFTRYHREQHTGSPLVVRGGMLEAREDALRFYHELRNPERDELAATFVHDVRLRVPGQPDPLRNSAELRDSLAHERVALPLEGGPRTIDLDRPPVAPTFAEAKEAGLAFRLPREIEAEYCDAEGRLSAEMRPFYMWGGRPIPPAKAADGPQIIDLPDGGKMGWASMETRSVMLEQPTAGMRTQSFAATVEIARKTNLRRYWIFDINTGRLLLANEVVELALHLGQRRAIDIPEDIRSEMTENLREDLR